MASTLTLRDPPLVSVIVTTRNSVRTLGRCLQSIQQQTYRFAQTILVDNFSEDATEFVARKFSVTFTRHGPERSAQRNLGASLAAGDCLFFVDADMELTPRVITNCVELISSHDALIVPETSIGASWVARTRAEERETYAHSRIYEAARFVRRDVFFAVGQYNTTLTGLEDYDLQANLEENGYRIGHATEHIFHLEDDLSIRQLMKKRAYYGRGLKKYTELHPERAAQQFGVRRLLHYFGRLRSSPSTLCRVLALKTLEATAVLTSRPQPERNRMGVDTGNPYGLSSGNSGGGRKPSR